MKSFSGYSRIIIFLLICSGYIFSSCSKELKAGPPVALVYDNVYVIGDASPAGWTIASALPMTRGTDNTSLFSWTGKLTAGEIKFPTAMNFSSDTFTPQTASQVITDNKARISPGGNPDVKWKLSAAEAGTYKIMLNTKDMTVTFLKQ